jgi:hypothetical protein
MTTLEDRLRDTFAAVDRQVVPPPMADERRRRVPTGGLVLLAAAAITVVVALTLGSFISTDRDVDVTAAQSTPAEFDAAVVGVCRAMIDGRSGQDPRFATSDAYRVVAEVRLTLIAAMRRSLGSIPGPSDDPHLVERAVSKLDRAAERAGYVIDLADIDRTDNLPQAWPAVDTHINGALRLLGEHGATACTP